MRYCPNCDDELKRVAAIPKRPLIEKIRHDLAHRGHGLGREPVTTHSKLLDVAQPRTLRMPRDRGSRSPLRPRVFRAKGSGLATGLAADYVRER